LGFVIARLRPVDWVLGASSLALFLVVFALPWFGLSGEVAATAASLGRPVSSDGWNSLVILGPLSLVVGALGVTAWWLQAVRCSPALPACVTMVEFLLSFLLLVGLVIRVLLDRPQVDVLAGAGNALGVKSGAYVALGCGVVAFLASYRSLRVEGVTPRDAPGEIETIALRRRDPARAR
jgi:hypothetical protein